LRRPSYLPITVLLVALAAGPVALGAGSQHGSSAIALDARSDLTRADGWFQESKSGGSSHEELFKWINFLIMAGALGYFLRKPLGDFFADRLDSIRQALSQGRRAVEVSDAKLAEIEAKLANVEREIAAFRVDSGREMQAERERLKHSADVEAQRILDFARVQIEAATRLAKAELKKYAAQQAVDLAEALIRQRIDDPARQRLVGSFVSGLKSKPDLKN
jgi:F-type H+-transporting ATPase subunit b